MTTAAYIEQEIVLWTSAMHAIGTSGTPTEYLRLNFKKLRKKWYAEAKKHEDHVTFDKFINPLNIKLTSLWKVRG